MTLRVRVIWSLCLSLLAAWGAYRYFSSLQQQVPIVIAAKAIPAHALIQPDMVRVIQVHPADRGQLVPQAIPDPQVAVGAVAVQEIAQGEPIRNDPRWITRLQGAIDAANKKRLSYFLPAETRAVTIVVDSQGVVAGRVKEGDLVDIHFTSRDDSSGGIYSALIMQQVRVIAVDGSNGQYQVTLLVSPDGALDLTLAKRRGTLDLALTPPMADLVNIPPSSPLKFSRMGSSDDAGRTSIGARAETNSPVPGK